MTVSGLLATTHFWEKARVKRLVMCDSEIIHKKPEICNFITVAAEHHSIIQWFCSNSKTPPFKNPYERTDRYESLWRLVHNMLQTAPVQYSKLPCDVHKNTCTSEDTRTAAPRYLSSDGKWIFFYSDLNSAETWN